MNKNMPVLLVLSIALGLFVFVLTRNLYYDAIKVSTAKKESVFEVGKERLELNSKVKNIPNWKTDKGEKHLYLNLFPSVSDWVLLHALSFSIGILSAIFMILMMYRIKKTCGITFFSFESIRPVVPILILFMISGVFLKDILGNQSILLKGSEIMQYYGIIFKNPPLVTLWTTICFAVIWMVPLIGILTIILGVQRISNMDSNTKKEFIARSYEMLRSGLNIFAFFLGLLVAVAVIGTKLQRNMIAEQVKGDITNIYPDHFIYGFGISFTLVLAMFFIPTLGYLKYTKNSKGIGLENKADSINWWAIGKETFADARLVLSITLPLLTSIIQELI